MISQFLSLFIVQGRDPGRSRSRPASLPFGLSYVLALLLLLPGLGSVAHAAAPVNTSVTPTSGTSIIGAERLFTATYTDTDGYADFTQCRLLLNATATGASGLYGYYSPSANLFSFYGDDGTTLSGNQPPGTGTDLTNSQGSLNCGDCTVTKSGNTITIVWAFTPSSSFTGAKNVYAFCKDATMSTGLVDMGNWTVSTNQAPTNDSVTPSSSTSSVNVSNTFTAKYSDPNGAADISEARCLISPTTSKTNQLMGRYTGGLLYLATDSGAGYTGTGVAPGTAGVFLENTQGKLDVAGTTVSTSGNTLTINWKFIPKTVFTGAKNVYLAAIDTFPTSTGFEDKGDWTINPDPPTAAPTGLSITVGSSADQLVLDWDDMTGVTYGVKRSPTLAGTYTTITSGLASSTYTNSGLTAGSTYYYKVFATNAGGNGPDSATVSGTALAIPAVPSGLTATAGNAQIVLTWTASANAASYVVQTSPTSGGTYTTVGTPSAATYTHTGLTNGTTYYYRVYAVNGSRNSANSSVVNSTPVAPPTTAPTGLAVTVGSAADQLVLNWTSMSGVTYGAKRSTTLAGTYTTFASGLSATTTTDSGLTAGSTYYYKVFATNAGGNGPDSAAVSGTALAIPGVPSGLTATAGNTQVSLSWTASANSPFYGVRRATTAGGPYTVLTTSLTSPSYVSTGLTNGTTYYYRVFGINGTRTGADSSEVSSTPPVAPTAAPTGLAVTVGANADQLVLNWTSMAGVNYGVKRSTTVGGTYTTLTSTLTSPTYTDSGLTVGSTYYYKVFATNVTGNGPDSAAVSGTTLALPGIPTGVTATAGYNQIVLNWTASANAVSYVVQSSSTSGGTYTTIASPTSPTYTHTGLTAGTTYYYRVYAVNGSRNSANSSVVNATVIVPVAPTNGTVSPNPISSNMGSATSITATYSDGNGASDLQYVYFLVNTTASGANALYVQYDVVNNLLKLRNDADSAWLGGFAPGSSHTITNGQGTLDCASTSVSLSGNTLSLTVNLTPINYSGDVHIFLRAVDLFSGQTIFQNLGDWSIVGLTSIGTYDGVNHVVITYDDYNNDTDFQGTYTNSPGLPAGVPLAILLNASVSCDGLNAAANAYVQRITDSFKTINWKWVPNGSHPIPSVQPSYAFPMIIGTDTALRGSNLLAVYASASVRCDGDASQDGNVLTPDNGAESLSGSTNGTQDSGAVTINPTYNTAPRVQGDFQSFLSLQAETDLDTRSDVTERGGTASATINAGMADVLLDWVF